MICQATQIRRKHRALVSRLKGERFDTSFKPMTPAAINVRQTNRAVSRGSLNNVIPSNALPTVPTQAATN